MRGPQRARMSRRRRGWAQGDRALIGPAGSDVQRASSPGRERAGLHLPAVFEEDAQTR